MVVFTCGKCNESLKKNQVEKHYLTRCRSCDFLSCVDCGKDFWGDTYKEHIKCISEEEKYSGKNYKPKPNANKGEVKQEQWLQKVQTAIDTCKAKPKLKVLLERMKDYPNIPRKKAKFENFVGNSMNVRDKGLIGEVWNLLLENAPKDDKKAQETPETKQEPKEEPASCNGTVTKGELKDQSKQEKKAERKRVKNSGETISDSVNGHVKNSQSPDEDNDKQSNKKKAKKRKRKDSEENGDEESAKKKHIDETESDNLLNETLEDDDTENKAVKFNWEDTITSVLKSKGEISLKKLKKKVLCEYLAQGCRPKSEEKLLSKLNKKISKNPNFVVKKERVKLKNSK